MLEKVLVVGSGSAASRHYKILKKLLPSSDFLVFAKHGLMPELDKADIQTNSIEDVLAFSPNLSVIANPAPLHMAISIELASIGSHLLIEKPISNSSKQVTELINLCEKNELVLGVGYNLRFLKSLVKLKELVDLGTIGKLLSIRVEAGENLARWRPSKDYRMTVSANKNLGGGPLLELSHEIDYIRWIFGEFNWVSSNLSKSSELEVDTEDCVHAFFEMENKQDKSKLIGTLALDFFRTDKQRTCTVIGNRGTLNWNGVSGKITQVMESNLENIESYEYEQDLFSTYELEWENFLSCVESGEKPMVTGSDALQTLYVIDAVIKSSKHENRQNVASHVSRTN